MKTAIEFLYEFYPCIDHEHSKKDFIKFCKGYDEYVESQKPKNELSTLIQLREEAYSEYLNSDGYGKFYRKEWQKIDTKIFNLVTQNYKQFSVSKYKNEVGENLLLVKTEVPEIIEYLNKKTFLYNAFTNSWEKLNYDNTFFSFIKNIALYL